MNTIRFNYLRNKVMKLPAALFRMSKNIIAACLTLPFHAVLLPVHFTIGGFLYVCSRYSFWCKKHESSLEPTNDIVVGRTMRIWKHGLALCARCSAKMNTVTNVVNLNNPAQEGEGNNPESNLIDHSTASSTAQIGVNEFSGRNHLLEIPIISDKAKKIAQNVKDKKEREMRRARKALKYCLNDQMPQTRQRYNTETKSEQRYSESSVMEYNFVQPKNAGNCYASNNAVDPDILEKHRQKKDYFDKLSHRSQRHKVKCLCYASPFTSQDKISCNEVSTINKMLRKIQITCSRLLGELSNLNDVLIKVISMKEKLSTLEFQVDEGKRLLQEVESDRFLMKSKLSALEKLINEEEKFLSGEVFCESGFYENVEAE